MACVKERETEIEKEKRSVWCPCCVWYLWVCVRERDRTPVCLFPLTVMRIMVIAMDHWRVLYTVNVW